MESNSALFHLSRSTAGVALIECVIIACALLLVLSIGLAELGSSVNDRLQTNVKNLQPYPNTEVGGGEGEG